MGLVTCLLLLHLVVPGFARGGHTAEAAVTAALDAVDAPEPEATSGTEAEGAGGERAGVERAGAERTGAERTGVEIASVERAQEPCPCGEEPSVRQPVARTPRAAGAARAGAVVTGAPLVDRGGTDVRAAGTGRRPEAVAPAPNAVELQTFRC
ncbi:hypothetical protein CA983_04275 [Streptomyces swartbergensis]|uniref:Secreted protein n=1 Tax=Streptomyces swartbergensis TaxID=487165 RepID=A0A243S9Q4_9ACTN|nr:hypothetical protein CA983_04275 [Streptomyces swartbergensis]